MGEPSQANNAWPLNSALCVLIMERKEIIYKVFLEPSGKISRFFTLLILILSSLLFIYIYWLINHYICQNFNCTILEITDIWVKQSFMFLIMATCNVFTFFFILKNKDIPNIYVLAITLGFITAAVISGYIPLAINHEIGNLT